MKSPANPLPPVLPGARVPTSEQTLRHLFLTLFLRGRTSRGMRKGGAPKSVAQKLTFSLILYALIGLMALGFLRQTTFALSAYLHAMSLVFLGMFVASSAGEILFNKEEADILLHRPIHPKALLWAKIRVLVEVSLWLAGAFNLAGFFVGMYVRDGSRLYPLVHAASTAMEALFCTGCVVMLYQLCLRFFGRERLEGLMTTAQVFVAVAAVMSGQILPRLMFRMDRMAQFNMESWWMALLPPAWFAGVDNALAGNGAVGSWLLAGLAVIATVTVLWLAFGKLAQNYQTGLQTLNETSSATKRKRSGRRWIDRLVSVPPLSWWLRNPVERASFLLTAAYLVRDRDVKLRVYPGVAPMLVLPFVFLMQGNGRSGVATGQGFSIAFCGCYLGLIPLLALNMLQYSQQWQAADVFRAAPLPGPGPLCHGARRAVLLFLTFPMLLVFAAVAFLLHNQVSELLLLLPGVVALPVYALIPHVSGKGAPLSISTDEAKAAGRGAAMIGVMLVSFALAGLASWSWFGGWFWPFVSVEAVAAVILYVLIRRSFARSPWPSME